jgi:hypothetical protein
MACSQANLLDVAMDNHQWDAMWMMIELLTLGMLRKSNEHVMHHIPIWLSDS